MFESLGSAIKQEQEKLEKTKTWLKKFLSLMEEQSLLEDPFVEPDLVYPIPNSVSGITQVAGVDGGIVSEAMTGFDLALYRAVAAVFSGVGKKVTARYIPHFDPEPQIFFSPSLPSRLEFNRICTLMRLYAEYEVAKMTVQQTNVSVVFIDGKVSPLSSDFVFQSNSKLLKQAEKDVKKIYNELVDTALKKKVVLCGVVKDSRSREYTDKMGKVIPQLIRSQNWDVQFMQMWPYILGDLQDTVYADLLLEVGQRGAWVRTHKATWISNERAEIWTTLVKLLPDDEPLKIEVLINPQDQYTKDSLDIALGSLNVLSNHGLPLALPTIILEADKQTKLSSDHLDQVIDQISLALGIPREQLRKRRYFTSSMN